MVALTSFSFKSKIMITKTYKSSSVLSICVEFPQGLRRRINFTPFSFGGSIYTTNNKVEQDALESSKDFNGLYVLYSTHDDGVADKPVINDEQQDENQRELEVVKVADIEDAKQYLIERGAKNLRGIASIKKAAEEMGVEFEGL